MDPISGVRFQATYRIDGEQQEALQRAREICLEQTVEFPAELIRSDFIRDQIVGRLESFTSCGDDSCTAVISYAAELAAGEFSQFLNVLFGNSSIKPGLRLVDFDIPAVMQTIFPGPRFGLDGLRERLQVNGRPLLCSALKPMGLSARELAELAYLFARGGIDIIKDDHGLSDQDFATFHDRVAYCSEAVARANRESGEHCIYVPNLSSSRSTMAKKVNWAKRMGVGGILFSPGLVGWEVLTGLATDDAFGLPILAHPALLGSYLLHPNSGIAHGVLLGKFMRLAGADGSIYPNFGGRFSFSRGECRDIVTGCTAPWAGIKPIFPAPGGGMNIDRVPEMLSFYGPDVILLMGGGLVSHGPDLIANCRRFRSLVEK